MRIFLKDVALRPSCYACPAKAGKSHADITLADYWGIETQHPEMDDDKGTCLLIVHTERGLSALDFGKMKTLEVGLEEAIRYNPSYLHAKSRPAIRDRFFDIYRYRTCSIDQLADDLFHESKYRIAVRTVKSGVKRIAKKLLSR